MSKLKWVGGALAGLLGLGVLGFLAGTWWANSKVDAIFAQTWEIHDVDFPIPFPLTEAEVAELRAEKAAELPEDAPEDADPLEGVDLEALALEHAVERGRHYVNSIYACTACHGADLGGGEMIDDQMLGRVFGPDITRGGRTASFTAADWDRAVRHGLLPDGTTSFMPVLDFKNLSDRELADIAAYVLSVPPKDGKKRIREWGPLGKMLLATGSLVPDAARVADHMNPHLVEPPPAEPNVTYGAHIIAICEGCHREQLNGGPITAGPPDWPPGSNLTPHEEGIPDYTYEDFVHVMRKGKKKNGESVKMPMSLVLPYGLEMTDVELKAMWAYLKQIKPLPTGK